MDVITVSQSCFRNLMPFYRHSFSFSDQMNPWFQFVSISLYCSLYWFRLLYLGHSWDINLLKQIGSLIGHPSPLLYASLAYIRLIDAFSFILCIFGLRSADWCISSCFLFLYLPSFDFPPLTFFLWLSWSFPFVGFFLCTLFRQIFSY